MRWYEQPEILSYIVDCYQGVEKNQRQFMWEAEGEVRIGNPRAFSGHLAEVFKIDTCETQWMQIHQALRDMGEPVREVQKHRKHGTVGLRFVNQEPKYKVVRVADGH